MRLTVVKKNVAFEMIVFFMNFFDFEGNQKEFVPNTKATGGYQQGNGSSGNNENDHSRFNRPNGHHKRKHHGGAYDNNSGRSNSYMGII